ncbi:MAG: glucose-6-phosphate isomerase, partial [Tannerella sp.]|nr:glucose-6-phosphate isomerase [Tannerella sp.]
MIRLDITQIYDTVSEQQINALAATVRDANRKLHDKNGAGNDFLGWLNLPSSITNAQLQDIEATAAALRAQCEVVVVIGIGGSYLGTKAVLEALQNSFDWLQTSRKNPVILYAGHHIGEDYLVELGELLKDKQFGIINISKSGTTTEPALAFRILREQLEAQVGKETARQRIVAITDKSRGALRKLADSEGYKTYVIPDDTGGRYSVLTPVGLLPIAVAGLNIRELVNGAVEMEKATDTSVPFAENIAAQYAAARNALYNAGKKIEILANFHPKMHYIGEWWKQLYGESEGKGNKGIFPASVSYTADLHSMGQYMQEGERTLFETFVRSAAPKEGVKVLDDPANADGLNFLIGKRIDDINDAAFEGTKKAHT